MLTVIGRCCPPCSNPQHSNPPAPTAAAVREAHGTQPVSDGVRGRERQTPWCPQALTGGHASQLGAPGRIL